MSTKDTPGRFANEWPRYVQPLASTAERLMGRLRDREDRQLRHDLYRSLMSQVSAGYFGVVYADAEHPDFWPYLSQAYPALAPNPDFSYYLTPLEDGGVYALSGTRGTVRRVDFQLGSGSFMPRGVLDDQKFGKTLANYDLDSIAIRPDGTFDVVLSATRPAGYDGAWWEMPTGTTYLFVRQVCCDWLHEVDGRLAIERLDRPAIKPRATADRIAHDLAGVAVWAENLVQMSALFAETMTANVGTNDLKYFDLTYFGGVLTQRYAYGRFDLADDEALIVEAAVPERVRYWSFQVLDELAFGLDWTHRQSSLNGHMASVDADGVFRAVICAQDPGVPNWLDTAGYRHGLIQARWEMCSAYPEHTVRKVKLADVRRALPPDTPVVTAAQRDAAIRLRRKGAQMRKRW